MPLTCPPANADTFDPRWLAGRDLIYLDLHGMPGQPYWLGDDGIVALTAEQIHGASLGNAVVFAINCYLADDDSPMLDALLGAGARYVIGGSGPNLGGQETLQGASLLGFYLRTGLAAGFDPLTALSAAKSALRVHNAVLQAISAPATRRANADALEFRAFYRRRP